MHEASRQVKRTGGSVSMLASSIRPLLRPMRIVLGVLAGFVLVQVVMRVFRRAVPEPMTWRLAPILTTRWRLRLFGIPEQVLDHAGVAPGMHALEVGPGPGVYTVPLAQRVASSGEDGRVTCLEIQPQMIQMPPEYVTWKSSRVTRARCPCRTTPSVWSSSSMWSVKYRTSWGSSVSAHGCLNRAASWL